MVRPVGGRAVSGQRTSLPSSDELNLAIGNQFGPRQAAGIGKITGPDYGGLPAAASYGEFDEIISLVQAKETLQYYDPETGTN